VPVHATASTPRAVWLLPLRQRPIRTAFGEFPFCGEGIPLETIGYRARFSLIAIIHRPSPTSPYSPCGVLGHAESPPRGYHRSGCQRPSAIIASTRSTFRSNATSENSFE
jgi:hypothetical protein